MEYRDFNDLQHRIVSPFDPNVSVEVYISADNHGLELGVVNGGGMSDEDNLILSIEFSATTGSPRLTVYPQAGDESPKVFPVYGSTSDEDSAPQS